jgi:hypothetical protein
MTRALPLLLLLPLVLVGSACGPGAGPARYSIVNLGTGEAIVKTINTTVGSRFTFGLVVDQQLRGLGADSAYTRRITLSSGVEAVVYSSPDEDVYVEPTGDGQLTWGGSSGVLPSAILSIKLPLKQDLEWETYDEKGVPWYHYQVEAVERVDVPAGTFVAARTLQLNLRTSTSVTRWYADEVGLVQRSNSLLLAYELNRSAP